MKRALITALTAVVLAATVTPALAMENINRREGYISAQIEHGVRSGALTRSEAEGLRAQLAQIQGEEQRLRHNGYGYHNHNGGLAPNEQAALERRLDDLSRQVAVESHNGARRY
jgi:hypothetical protein